MTTNRLPNLDQPVANADWIKYAAKQRTGAARVAYSEDQPRDAHGRFGESTGTTETPQPAYRDQIASLQAAYPQATIVVDSRTERALSEYPRSFKALAAVFNGTVTAAVRLAQEYPSVASGIKTLAFGEGQDAGSIGEYVRAGAHGELLERDERGNLLDPKLADTPMIKIDVRTGANDAAHISDPGRYSLVADFDPQRYGEGIFTHEFGHAVDYAKTPDGGTAASVWGAHISEMAPGAERHISDYAMTNSHDYFAEAFAANDLGFADRLDGFDRQMLASAVQAAVTPAVEKDGVHSDMSFAGSIVEEYARGAGS